MTTSELQDKVIDKIVQVGQEWLTGRGYPLTYINAEVLRHSIEGAMPLLLRGAIVALAIRELDSFLEEVVGKTTRDALELNRGNLQVGNDIVVME